MKMEMFLLLIMVTFASEQKENDAENLILVKIEEDECTKVHKTSQYIGVSYIKERTASWRASRWSKNKNKMIYNGCNYKDEETAAHASDTLARKLMKNGEQNLKLNFTDDDTEVNAEGKTSEYVGVSYCESKAKWRAYRGSKNDSRQLYNGTYKDEETAAHASDTLARKLMKNGEQNLKLNFPDDDTEVYPEKETTSSIYIGVNYNKKNKLWIAQRRNKRELFYNGSYKDEITAAHASDTLARQLMENGEHNHKLNFPDNDTERQTNKRKRSENEDFGHSHNK